MSVGWLCWGLTSQSTIFQSCRDGAIASWVINQYFRGVKCLAQGHNTAAVGLEPRTSRSGVRHSTTEPPRSPCMSVLLSLTCTCLLLPFWSEPVYTVTTLIYTCLSCYHTDLYLPTVTTLTCLYWPVSVSTVTTLTSTCLYYHHWSVHVCPVTTLTCTCCYNTDLYGMLSLTCACLDCYLFDLCTVHVSTVTTLTCISLSCYHTDLYLFALLPHQPPVPVYCIHTDLSQSLLLPHWHVPVCTVTTDLYMSQLLSHWPITTDLYLALLLY